MKTDLNLGLEVKKYLVEKGVETPLKNSNYTKEDQRKIIEESFSKIMSVLGLDLQDDSLTETPRRVAKMYVDEIFSGLDYENFPKCTTVENKMKYDEMVVVDKITSLSNCEHHFVVIDGLARIAYIPKDKVLGLSKINRLVQFFSKRPQIQERLTEQIFHALCFILDTEDVAVKLTATHFCVKSRGVEDTNSDTTTTRLGGVFKQKPEVRAEFINL
jgi:GTP cyclohydrolase IA